MMVRFSFIQDVLIKLSMPFYLIYLTFKLLFVMKVERNGFKTNENVAKLTAHKNVELIPDLNIQDVKKRAAELTTP